MGKPPQITMDTKKNSNKQSYFDQLKQLGFWLFLGIACCLNAFKLWQIDTVPATLAHDELFYVVQAQTLKYWGTDPTGSWSPWSFTPAHPLYAEWPGFLMSLTARLAENPIVGARLASIGFSISFPFLLAILSWQFWRSRSIALATLLVASWNPWLIQTAHLSFDALFSIWWFTLAVIVQLHFSGSKKLLAVPIWIIGFWQYQGLKVVLPFVVASVSWYNTTFPSSFQTLPLRWASTKKILNAFTKQNWIDLLTAWAPTFAVGISMVLLMTVLAPNTASQGRIGEMLPFQQTLLAQKTNELRRLALVSSDQVFFINKLTVLTTEMLFRLSKVFEPYILFFGGESIRNPFTVWSYGFFLPFDAIWFIIGSIAIWSESKNRKTAVLLVFWLAIAALPSILNAGDPWVFFRSAWIIPGSILLIGWALGKATLKMNFALLLAVATCYGVSILGFHYEYWHRYPVYSTAGSAWGEHVLASYISRIPSTKKVVVLTDESEFVFMAVSIFNRYVTATSKAELSQAFKERSFTYQNVTVQNRCLKAADLAPDTIVINEARNVWCSSETDTTKPNAAITSPIDAATLFTIYQEELCQPYIHRSWMQITSMSDLKLDKQTDQTFCEKNVSVIPQK